MTQYFRFNYGMSGLTDSRSDKTGADLMIRYDAEFWSLPEEKQLPVLRAARSLTIYVRDVEYIAEWLPESKNTYQLLRRIPEYLAAVKRAPDNPFLSDYGKEFAAKLLQDHNTWLENKNRKRTYPKKLRNEVVLRDGNHCRYCGEIADPITIDHVVPFIRGGQHVLENLVVCCMACNGKKNYRTLEEAGMTLLEVPA